jgi:hypothetical protein
MWTACQNERPLTKSIMNRDRSMPLSAIPNPLRIGINRTMIKNAVFRIVAKCGSCKNQCFGESCRLHLQGENEQTRNKGNN